MDRKALSGDLMKTLGAFLMVLPLIFFLVGFYAALAWGRIDVFAICFILAFVFFIPSHFFGQAIYLFGLELKKEAIGESTAEIRKKVQELMEAERKEASDEMEVPDMKKAPAKEGKRIKKKL